MIKKNNGPKRVAVLLSVYKPNLFFLGQLLASLKAQRDVSIKLLCRVDDLDEKEGVIYLERIKTYFPDVDFVVDDNVGPAFSFFQLMTRLDKDFCFDCDYFAFCDQDDYWMPDKLITAVQRIESTGAVGYASRVNICNENLDSIGLSTMPSEISFVNAICENVIYGCTFVGKISLLKVLVARKPFALAMHDSWTYLCTMAFFDLEFDDRAYIKYRQHEGNVIGAKGSFHMVTKSFHNIFRKSIFKKRETEQLQAFYDIFQHQLSQEKRDKVELYLAIRFSVVSRIKALTVFKRNENLSNVILKLKIICGQV